MIILTNLAKFLLNKNYPLETKMFTKSIRRALIASGLVLGATAAFSPTAFAQTATTTVPLSGTVTSTLAITATPTTEAGALALDGAAAGVEQIVKAADLEISTNNEQGYNLSVTSGNLIKDGGTSIAYQVTTVADGAVAPATAGFTVASGTAYTVSIATAGSAPQDLYIKYTPAALQDAGAYAGTITLNVADN